MSFYQYVLTAWLLLSAVVLSRQKPGPEPILTSGLRVLTFSLALLALTGFNLLALSVLPALAAGTGIALVLFLTVAFTHNVIGRHTKQPVLWALMCLALGVILSFFWLAEGPVLNHR